VTREIDVVFKKKMKGKTSHGKDAAKGTRRGKVNRRGGPFAGKRGFMLRVSIDRRKRRLQRNLEGRREGGEKTDKEPYRGRVLGRCCDLKPEFDLFEGGKRGDPGGDARLRWLSIRHGPSRERGSI